MALTIPRPPTLPALPANDVAGLPQRERGGRKRLQSYWDWLRRDYRQHPSPQQDWKPSHGVWQNKAGLTPPGRSNNPVDGAGYPRESTSVHSTVRMVFLVLPLKTVLRGCSGPCGTGRTRTTTLGLGRTDDKVRTALAEQSEQEEGRLLPGALLLRWHTHRLASDGAAAPVDRNVLGLD